MSTVKFFWVPRLPQSHKERTSDDLIAVGTHGSSLPCWNVLSSLHQCVLVTWLGQPRSWVRRYPCTWRSHTVCNSCSRRCCLVWTLPAWWLDNAGGSYRLEGSSRLETSHAWPAWTWGLEALRLAQRWSSGWRWLLRRLLSATGFCSKSSRHSGSRTTDNCSTVSSRRGEGRKGSRTFYSPCRAAYTRVSGCCSTKCGYLITNI